jgi:CO/xanthine dehydrogenase Mo-binding subunit
VRFSRPLADPREGRTLVADYAVIGKRFPRPDAPEKVTGRAVYGMDLKRPGMLHAKILWPAHAHARIKAIDVSEAIAVPGVKAALTAQDVPDVTFPSFLGPTDRRIFAKGKVHMAGDPVAAVAAETEEAAQEAVRLIRVEYEPLPVLVDPEEAMKPDAPWVADAPLDPARTAYRGNARNVCAYTRIRCGDIERGFAEADTVHEERYETAMVHQGYLEPQVAVAEVDSSGKLTVWSSTQSPFAARLGVAATLQLPLTKVRVIALHVGGGFGGKSDIGYEPLVAAVALRTGRPVRLALTREEEFQATFPRHPFRVHLKMGARRDGTLVALRATAIADTGGYAGLFGPMCCGIAAHMLTAPYKVPNVDVEVFSVMTNKPNCGAYRAPMTTQAAFAVESHMDMLAGRLGMDSVELRLKNAWDEGTKTAIGQTMPRIGLKAAIRAAAERIGWGRESLGPNQGIGLAAGTWMSTGMLGGGAYLKVQEDGSIVVVTGGGDSGSGATVGGLRVIAAEELGVSPDDVVVQSGDTDSGPHDTGAVGSRTLYSLGNAVRLAAIDAKQQLLGLAAQQLGADPSDLELKDKTVRVKARPDRAVPLAALAMTALHIGSQVLGRGSYAAAPPALDPGHIEGIPPFPLLDPTPAAHAAKVEVDPRTGRVKILRYVAAQDVGVAINPLSVEGQIEGGSSEGIGEALSEEVVFDSKGRVLNPTLLDYKMPTMMDHPLIESIIVEGYPGGGPFGAKGVGEASIIPPPAAIANAIYHAVGARVTKLPLSPENVWAALKESRG